jgi:hypothetical protein
MSAARKLVVGAARAALPESFYGDLRDRRDKRRRQQAERYPPAQRIDVSVASLIRELPDERLHDADYLETELLPRLGLNDERLEEFPQKLYEHTGKGLRYWQYPSQFSKYLVEVGRHRPRSYLEIGVRHGGTFVLTAEFIERLAGLELALGDDIQAAPGLAAYARGRDNVKVITADSQSRTFRRHLERHGPFDLALIDGDHGEEPVKEDFELVRHYAHMLAFHDIVSEEVPGVGAAWRFVCDHFADTYDFTEYTDQYDDVAARTGKRLLGIGLAVDRRWAAGRRNSTSASRSRSRPPCSASVGRRRSAPRRGCAARPCLGPRQAGHGCAARPRRGRAPVRAA